MNVQLRHSIDVLLNQLKELERAGGPTPLEYEATLRLFAAISAARTDTYANDAIRAFREQTPSFASLDTMHGFVCRRPHGYAGDFEIIDRIYNHHLSGDPQLRRWDAFFHAGDASSAVRARKTYCVELFLAHAQSGLGTPILNVGSGSCRDVLEFKQFGSKDAAVTHVHCVDLDVNAIAFGRELLAPHVPQVTFEQRNAMRLAPSARYGLVWSAGLFDYFEDRLFVAMLRRLSRCCLDGGEIVVGNFAPHLQSRPYMEFGDWRLNYRTADRLIELGLEAGFARSKLSVRSEPSGVNLFLHIARC